MTTVIRRGAPLAAACALALALPLTAGAPALAGAADAQDAAASWLSSQAKGGTVFNEQYQFTDYGTTVDTGLALTALDRKAGRVAQIAEAMSGAVDSYTTGADFGSDHVYAGSLAKLAVFVADAGQDPTSFGGADLVARLEDRISEDPVTAGRLEDLLDEADRPTDDYSNTLGQAFAVEALADAGSPAAQPALDFLLSQQCADGYFRVFFTADKTAADQSCDGGDPAGSSAPDTDATASAVVALASIEPGEVSGPAVPAIADALARAQAWLESTQAEDGSYGGGPATQNPNTNSTGLASTALAAVGSCDAAREAARWVKGLQVDRALAVRKLKGEQGAIAYDPRALKKGKRKGITVETRGQWQIASVQAAPALLNLSKATCAS